MFRIIKSSQLFDISSYFALIYRAWTHKKAYKSYDLGTCNKAIFLLVNFQVTLFVPQTSKFSKIPVKVVGSGQDGAQILSGHAAESAFQVQIGFPGLKSPAILFIPSASLIGTVLTRVALNALGFSNLLHGFEEEFFSREIVVGRYVEKAGVNIGSISQDVDALWYWACDSAHRVHCCKRFGGILYHTIGTWMCMAVRSVPQKKYKKSNIRPLQRIAFLNASWNLNGFGINFAQIFRPLF